MRSPESPPGHRHDRSAGLNDGAIRAFHHRRALRPPAPNDDESKVARQIVGARTALAQCNRALTRASNEQNLLDTICRIAVGVAGYSLAWVGFAEHDERKTVRPVARYGEAAQYLDEISVTWGDDALGRGPTGKSIRTGRVSLARDLARQPEYELWRATAARHGLASSLSLPLLKDGVAFGAFTVYAPEPDAFGETEIEVLTELADDLAFGIRMLRERSERDQLALAIDIEADEARRAMIAGLCHFAAATGCRLIAEGIETDGELAALRLLEIQLGQGYLLGRPVPAGDTAAPWAGIAPDATPARVSGPPGRGSRQRASLWPDAAREL